jgi:hypothetical protein
MKKTAWLCAVVLLFITTVTKSQGLYKVAFEEKVNNSSLIIEGKVISKKSFWNSAHTMIYTSNEIDVFKIFKGSLLRDTIEIATVGGSLEGEAVEASHLLSLEVNDIGVFFCFPNKAGLRALRKKETLYDVYASEQGFLKYDPSHKKASTPFVQYESIENQLYPELQKRTQQSYKNIKSSSVSSFQKQSQTLAVSITGFAPATVNAGAILDPATNVLTITGSGFGSPSGSAAVFFDDADDGTGGNFIGIAYNSPLMISWSSTSIQLRVPARAGTGFIRVQDDVGNISTSSTPLTVNYSVQTVSFTDPSTSITYAKEANLCNRNGSGGYTIHYSTSTAGSGVDITSSAAMTTFQRALTTWKDIAGFNVVEGANNVVQSVSNDGNNQVMFDNANTGNAPLATGVLAVCYSYYSLCTNDYANNQAIKTGFDIVIRNSGFSTGTSAFTLGPCPPNSSDYTQLDLETVILHELGHAIGLGHINDTYQGNIVGQINPGKLMNYAVVNSVKRVSPDYSAFSGALYLTTPQANTYGLCGFTEMTQLAMTLESKDNCPASFPLSSIPQGTVVNFDLAHATSNSYVDPAYTQFRCDALGGAQTNNAYYAFKSTGSGGSLLLSVSGYTGAPLSLATCSQIYGGVPVTGIRLALYQVSSCPAAGSYPTPIACATITGNGTLSPIASLAGNSNYLIYVEGIENTKANFSLQFGGTVLPVRFTNFSGTSLSNYNLVQWKAEAVANVEKIVVQKSADGIRFEPLGEVLNWNEFFDGNMRDLSPFSRTYYRLAIYNSNRSIDYSNIVILEREKGSAITAYPNPASKLLNIQINYTNPGSYFLKLYNNMGQLVKQQNAQAGQTIKIQTADLSSGIYQLDIYKEGAKLESNKIIIVE